MGTWKARLGIVCGLASTLALSQGAIAGAPPGSTQDGVALQRSSGLIITAPDRDPGNLTFQLFGAGSDTLVVGDWNGDGVDTLGVVRAVGGALLWILDTDGTGTNLSYQLFGADTDTPVPGDWNPSSAGTEVGVVRSTTDGLLWIVSGDGGLAYQLFGTGSDTPVPGNWDDTSDGDEPGVTRDGGGGALLWITQGSGGLEFELFGASSDKPVPGNYDDDALSERGVFQDLTGTGRFALQSDSSTEAFLMGDGTENPFAGAF
jgi:hypothetical protein